MKWFLIMNVMLYICVFVMGYSVENNTGFEDKVGVCILVLMGIMIVWNICLLWEIW